MVSVGYKHESVQLMHSFVRSRDNGLWFEVHPFGLQCKWLEQMFNNRLTQTFFSAYLVTYLINKKFYYFYKQATPAEARLRRIP